LECAVAVSQGGVEQALAVAVAPGAALETFVISPSTSLSISNWRHRLCCHRDAHAFRQHSAAWAMVSWLGKQRRRRPHRGTATEAP